MFKRLLDTKAHVRYSNQSSTTKMSYLDKDHKIEAPPGTPKLHEHRGQNTDTNFRPGSQNLPEVPDWRVADKTPYPPSLQYDTLLRDSEVVAPLHRYGNPPKPSPYTDKSTGELDYRALEKYYDNCKYPQKPSSNCKPRISTDQTAQPRRRESPDRTIRTASSRRESLDRTLRTPSIRPPLTGANAIPLGLRRRDQKQRSTSRNEHYGSTTVFNQQQRLKDQL